MRIFLAATLILLLAVAFGRAAGNNTAVGAQTGSQNADGNETTHPIEHRPSTAPSNATGDVTLKPDALNSNNTADSNPVTPSTAAKGTPAAAPLTAFLLPFLVQQLCRFS
ncbi:uncharacterized protein LOC144157861 [Haemaphysalis longicornis]